MASDNHRSGAGNGPKASRWGVAVALVLIAAIALFTGFESHLL